jgi:hypothetical protein
MHPHPIPVRKSSTLVRAALVVSAALLLPLAVRAQSYGPNVFPEGSFDSVTQTYVPWAGVDGQGNLHGIDGKQIAVDDDGKIETDNYGRGSASFAPGIAVADLNGDGKPDLVVADSFGFFWFYPNSGSKAKPAFTQGEIMPIWLGEERVGRDVEGYDNVVPRIQLLDVNGTRRYDLVVGTYDGKLYVIPNQGNPNNPVFKPTTNLEPLLINTHRNGGLWCNYLSPFMTAAFNQKSRFDLLMGEGTYSANSIYLARDQNSSGNPTYDEDHLDKIIPGMGSEQLTPCIVDWNNDGKPDVICGDRTGFLDLYINNSTDPDHLSFAPPVHVKIAGQEKLGNSITVCVCDFSENGLPNLLIGKDDGTINYCVNTGKLGAPVFLVPPTPLKGVLPPEYKQYTTLKDWTKQQDYGVPYEMVSAVNPQLEPGFTFPEGETTHYAMKFFVWPYKSTYFPDRFTQQTSDQWRQPAIACGEKFTLKLNKRYKIHFWAKADNNMDLGVRLSFVWKDTNKYTPPESTDKTVSIGTNWTECSTEVEFDNSIEPAVTDWDFLFDFRFTGQPTFYIDDLQIQEQL